MNAAVRSTATSRRLPWQKLVLTIAAGSVFTYFWINGPLQERPPVFKFTENVKGFGEPVRVGDEYVPPKFAVVGAAEEHAYYHIMTAKNEPRPVFGVIGDARNNPGLKPEVGTQVLEAAKRLATNPIT